MPSKPDCPREHTAITLSASAILALRWNAKGQASSYQRDCFSFMSCWQGGAETFMVGNALLWNAFLLAACQSQVWQSLWYSEEKNTPLFNLSFRFWGWIAWEHSSCLERLGGKGSDNQVGAPFLAYSNYFPSDKQMINSFPFSAAIMVYWLHRFLFEWWFLKRWMDHNNFVGNCKE